MSYRARGQFDTDYHYHVKAPLTQPPRHPLPSSPLIPPRIAKMFTLSQTPRILYYPPAQQQHQPHHSQLHNTPSFADRGPIAGHSLYTRRPLSGRQFLYRGGSVRIATCEAFKVLLNPFWGYLSLQIHPPERRQRLEVHLGLTLCQLTLSPSGGTQQSSIIITNGHHIYCDHRGKKSAPNR